VLDLIGTLKLPVIVVGRAGLGGINHALLTIDALHRRKLPPVALVLNRTRSMRSEMTRLQERATIEALRRSAGVPVLGPLPYDADMGKSFRRSVIRLSRTAAVAALARLVRTSLR
jgi:dethiobiotin synthetase